MTESFKASDPWQALTAGDGVKQVRYGLIVEDLPDAREWLIAAMGEAFPGVSIATAASLADARSQIAEQLPQIALIDIGLPDGSGIDLIDELNQGHCEWRRLRRGRRDQHHDKQPEHSSQHEGHRHNYQSAGFGAVSPFLLPSLAQAK